MSYHLFQVSGRDHDTFVVARDPNHAITVFLASLPEIDARSSLLAASRCDDQFSRSHHQGLAELLEARISGIAIYDALLGGWSLANAG